MGIKQKLSVSFGLLFILMLAVLWLALKLQLEQTLSQQSRTLGQILTRQTADSVTELVLANDLLGLNVVLGQLTAEQGVHSIVVTNVDGQVLASSTASNVSARSGLTYEAPITLQDAVAGRIMLTLDTSLLSNPLVRPQTVFYLIIIISLLLVLVFSWVLANGITRPARSLLVKIDNPETLEDETAAVFTYADDEFGLLQARVHELLQRQQELTNQIASTGLPDPEDMKKLNLRAERRMGSMLLVDVAGIDTAIELLHPATLSTLLQEYQFYLRQAARLYRGVVTRTDGGKTLVSFDVRHCADEHALNAICCGQLFLKLMQQVAARHRANNAQSLDFRLVVHSGDAYYSPLWVNKKKGVEAKRLESVIGKTADLVYEMLPHARNGHVLASELSFDLAGRQKRFGQSESCEIRGENDNLALMAYILSPVSGQHATMLDKQCQHLMPEAGT